MKRHYWGIAALGFALCLIVVSEQGLRQGPQTPSLPTQAVLPTAAISLQPTIERSETTSLPDAQTPEPAPLNPLAQQPDALNPSAAIPTATSQAEIMDAQPAHERLISNAVPNTVVLSLASLQDDEYQEYVRQLSNQGFVIEQTIPALKTLIVKHPSQHETLVLPPGVQVVSEPDFYVSAQSIPYDPLMSQQYNLEIIGMSSLWQHPPASAPKVIAIIDSGVNDQHPDLVGQISAQYDVIDDDSTAQDTQCGHGTAVTGIIAAAHNEIGIAGLAPQARILVLRVLDESCLGRYSDVAEAIVYAVDHGAQIINLSLGGPNESALLRSAIDYALRHDVIIVAAAGNQGADQPLFPARYEPVIAVGASTKIGDVASFSNRGYDVLAPGTDILSTRINGDYGIVSGTSFAAPQITGLLALGVDLAHINIAPATPSPVITATDEPTFTHDGPLITSQQVVIDLPLLTQQSEELKAEGTSLTFQAGTRGEVLIGPYDVSALHAEPFLDVSSRWEVMTGGLSDLSILLETSQDGTTWAEGHSLTDFDQASEYVFGNLHSVDQKTTLVRLRLTWEDLSSNVTLTGLTLFFVSPGLTPSTMTEALAASSSENASAQAYGKPTVKSRSEWGNPQGNGNGDCWVPEYTTVTHIVVHHTATPNTDTDWAARVRSIWNYHTYTMGWCDIGYHYLIDPNGVIYEGRYGGDGVVGAHAYGSNFYSIGYSLLGQFDDVTHDGIAGGSPTSTMINSLDRMIAWKADQLGFDPTGSAYQQNMGREMPRVFGHRDVNGGTECPGDNVYALLPSIRQAAKALLTPITVPTATPTITPTVAPTVTPPVLNAPVDHATMTTSRPVLSWLAVSEATAYELQFDAGGGFNNVATISLPPTTLSYTPTAPLIQVAYQWRVRTVAGADRSAWSQPRTFTVNDPVALPLAWYFTTASPTLTWSPVPNALQYELIVDDSDSTTPVRIYSTTAAEYTVGPLLDGHWTYKVRARLTATTWTALTPADAFEVDVR